MEVLRRAASDGQLSVDELEERVTSAYGARTRKELERLIADVSAAPLGRDSAVATPERAAT